MGILKSSRRIAFLLLIMSGIAAEVTHAQLSMSLAAEQERTSDSFSRQGLLGDLSTCHRDLFWPYKKECAGPWEWGAHWRSYKVSMPGATAFASEMTAFGNEGSISLGVKVSPEHLLTLEVGAHQLRALPNRDQITLGVGGITYQWKAHSTLDLSFLSRRDFVYQELKLPSGFEDALSAWNYTLRGLGRFRETWRIPFLLVYRQFSDTNTSSEFDLGVLYGISPGVPWIWAGLGCNQLVYSLKKSGYWTPEKVTSLGPRLEMDLPLGQKFSLNFGGNLNEIYEQGLPETQGFVFSAGLKYGSRDEANFYCHFLKIQAGQTGNPWSSDGLSCGLNY